MRFFLTTLFVLLLTSFSFAESVPTPNEVDSVITPVAGQTKDLFEKAKKLFDDKSYKDCKEILASLVAQHPMDDFVPQARLMLAKVQEDFDVSVAQLREVAEQYDDKPEGRQAQKELGDRFYLADKYSDAVEAYQEFLTKYKKAPEAVEVHYWMGSSYLAAGNTDKAVDEYQRVLDDGKETAWAPKALLGMGNAFFKTQKFSDAENRYLRILDQYALYDELNLVYLKLGETYEMEKKWKQAFAAYETLIDRYPKAMEVSEAQMRVDELAKLHPELKSTVTAAATPTVLVTATVMPTATVAAPPFVTATPEPTVEATAVVADATPEEAEQEETADQPVLKSTPFHVQVGVYTKRANVVKTEKAIHKAGYKYYVVTVHRDAQTLYKVRVGNFTSRSAAQKVANILVKKTKEKAIVVEE